MTIPGWIKYVSLEDVENSRVSNIHNEEWVEYSAGKLADI